MRTGVAIAGGSAIGGFFGALVGAGAMGATAASSRGITYLFSKHVGQPNRSFNSEVLSRKTGLDPKLAKPTKPK